MMVRPALPLLLLALFTLFFALPALAGPPPKKAATAAAPKMPPGDPQMLVDKGKVFAFYDPNDLSKPPYLSAKSAILIDADTGQVLWEKNADVIRAPASTTKIMTGLLLAEHTQPEDIITVKDKSITKIEPSSLHLKMWEKLSAQDLLYGMMLRSGNDASVLVAHHISGSVANFAQLMNQRARELGATSTNFVNPHGLSHPNHLTTARDLAIITRAALQNPRFADAVGTPRRKLNRTKSKDLTVASKAKKFYGTFPGADGVKTGYTRAAGYCFVGSATRDGRRLLSVILGARDNASGETMPLLSWGFRRFPAVPIARRGETVRTVPVKGGEQPDVPVIATADLHATVDSINGDTAAVVGSVTWEIEGAGNLWAPIRQGQEAGRLVAKVNGVTVHSVPVIAGADVPASPLRAAATGSGKLGLMVCAGIGGLLLVGWGYGTASAKSARRRRRRLASSRGGDDRPGPRRGRRSGNHYAGNARRPGHAED